MVIDSGCYNHQMKNLIMFNYFVNKNNFNKNIKSIIFCNKILIQRHVLFQNQTQMLFKIKIKHLIVSNPFQNLSF